MRWHTVVAWVLACSAQVLHAQPARSDCSTVKFADVGWTDVSVTTALAALLVEGLGLNTKIHQLSVPVTFASLKNRDVDVFLGNWMPTMAADIKPYSEDGSVETLKPLLVGARYTLAVPKYVAEAGVHAVADLNQHKKQFQGRIYGIEAGNDGNRLIQEMIESKAFGLNGWKLVESSEQAMLMQAVRAAKAKRWIVFLAWEPHPMNRKLDLVYLNGGDNFFGPNQGSSKVYINTRRGYSKECPVAAQIFKKLELTVAEVNELMSLVLDQKLTARGAALQWLRKNPERLTPWLKELKAADGRDANQAVKQHLNLAAGTP